jgi:nucleoside-diphosphate-sugar epimerase
MLRSYMKSSILIMGAGGRLGYAAAEAFRDAGWHVKSLVRPGKAAFAPSRTQVVEVVTRDAAIEAASGCAVVLNALNPMITMWQRDALAHAYAGIAAAESNGATLIFPGSTWNFGRDMPEVIDENTPQHPTMRKGRMRAEIEQRIQEACDRGMRAIVLRAGDFFGSGRGSWFDLVLVKELEKDRVTYPGRDDVIHPWAYLPDLADAAVKLAECRDRFAPYEVFGFPGYSVTGLEMIAAIEAATRNKVNVRHMTWWTLRTIGQLMKLGRELSELEYLWQVPHRIDGSKLEAAIGKIPHTPFHKAVAMALRDLGYRT